MIEFAAGLSLLKPCLKPRLLSCTVTVVSGTLLLTQLALADYTVVAVSNGGTIQGVVKLAARHPPSLRSWSPRTRTIAASP